MYVSVESPFKTLNPPAKKIIPELIIYASLALLEADENILRREYVKVLGVVERSIFTN